MITRFFCGVNTRRNHSERESSRRHRWNSSKPKSPTSAAACAWEDSTPETANTACPENNKLMFLWGKCIHACVLKDCVYRRRGGLRKLSGRRLSNIASRSWRCRGGPRSKNSAGGALTSNRSINRVALDIMTYRCNHHSPSSLPLPLEGLNAASTKMPPSIVFP